MASAEHRKVRKRISIKPNRPNPLFEKWLEEWKLEAQSKGSDMQYAFGKALASLKKYPLPLKSGQDCLILNNFGNRLCCLLDRKLAEYKKENPKGTFQDTSENTFPVPSKERKPQNTKKQQKNTQVKDLKKKTTRKYVPAWRSAPYAILLTLLENEGKLDYPGYLTKEQLQTQAQPLCDASFKRPEPGTFYTAWSSMSGLVRRGLVDRRSSPAKFSLTETGRELAVQLLSVGESSACSSQVPEANFSDSSEADGPQQTSSSSGLCSSSDACETLSKKANLPFETEQNDMIVIVDDEHDNYEGITDEHIADSPIIKNSSPSKQVAPLPTDPVIFLPGSFDVLLLVDKNEINVSLMKDMRTDATVQELSSFGTLFELRHLKIGDFAWVCRHRNSGDELVLPYIVERKRMDDLAKSITDGRFHEQKYRLKRCGLDNLIYLVESHGDNQHTILPLESLLQATVNTQVTDGFKVKFTNNHRESMLYLTQMSKLLFNAFRHKTLLKCSQENLPPFRISDDLISLMSFSDFNEASKKSKETRVKDMLMKHLLQLHGLSVEKAKAIIQQYPTPRTLIAAYQEGQGEKHIASLRYGSLNSTVGPALSRTLHQVYTA